jgi:hypothetical protein
VQVVNKWLVLQAMSDIPGNVNNVKALLDHPAFDIKNPNKVCVIFFCTYVKSRCGGGVSKNRSVFVPLLDFLNYFLLCTSSSLTGSAVNFSCFEGVFSCWGLLRISCQFPC